MTRKNNIKTKNGFTIIEVVLVLAIAGLIFLMVFIALPALQRSQRNTQRRDDYSMLVTAVNSYMASNNGKLNNLAQKQSDKNVLSASRWINSSGQDPNGNDYRVEAWMEGAWLTNNPNPGASPTKAFESVNAENPGSLVYIIIKANCNGVDGNGDPYPETDSSNRAFAVYGYLEGGSVFCQDSGSNGSVKKAAGGGNVAS